MAMLSCCAGNLGETGITHYHGTSEGFSGRKPIDGRIFRGPKKRN